MSEDGSRARSRVLVISPHVDDEVLGCSAILNRDCHVHFCGINEDGLREDPGRRIPMQDRETELARAASFFGYSYSVNRGGLVNRYKIEEQIESVEDVINNVQPQDIFIPFRFGYNQDHVVVYDACRVALRPHDRNHFVKRVFVYEAVHDLLWSSVPFAPVYFIPLDVERKIQGYLCHKSQVRGMRSPEMIRAHARVRGMAANCDCAEAFMIEWWVE